MPTKMPIACNLTADQMPQRITDASQLGREGLLDVSTDGPRAELRFKTDAQTRAGIEQFIAAESECCPFFAFELAEESAAVVLAIEAPEEGAWALRGVVAGIVSGWEMPA
jgi:hypothetical protein